MCLAGEGDTWQCASHNNTTVLGLCAWWKPLIWAPAHLSINILIHLQQVAKDRWAPPHWIITDDYTGQLKMLLLKNRELEHLINSAETRPVAAFIPDSCSTGESRWITQNSEWTLVDWLPHTAQQSNIKHELSGWTECASTAGLMTSTVRKWTMFSVHVTFVSTNWKALSRHQIWTCCSNCF